MKSPIPFQAREKLSLAGIKVLREENCRASHPICTYRCLSLFFPNFALVGPRFSWLVCKASEDVEAEKGGIGEEEAEASTVQSFDERFTCDLAAILQVHHRQSMHLSHSSKPRISQGAAALQVQGCYALQAVQGQKAGVYEGHLPTAIQGE